MKELNYDLKKHKDITGKLVLTIPTYRQRLKMIKDCNFKVSEKGQINVGNETLDSMVKLIDLAEPHFKKIDLTCGEITVKNFKDMESNPEFDTLITEAATTLLNAGSLGK